MKDLWSNEYLLEFGFYGWTYPPQKDEPTKVTKDDEIKILVRDLIEQYRKGASIVPILEELEKRVK